MKGMVILAMLLVSAQGVSGQQADWKAGAARVRVTPEKRVWMTGYGSRVKVSEGVITELYARAVAVDDGSGRVAVLVNADVLGFPAEVGKRIAEEVRRRHGIARDRLILSSTHTHGGPAVAHLHHMMYGVRATAAELADVEAYTRGLEGKIVGLVGEAIKAMRPARLRFGHGQATFAINRRKKTNKGFVIDVDPQGPVDHDLPVMRVEAEDGKLLAVVFGYACHNTTVGGDCYQLHGDYAGFAAERLEKEHAGTVAVFVQGCGADANPQPRGTIELAQRHGEDLAAAVEKAIGGEMKGVNGPMRAAYAEVGLAFASPPSRQQLQEQSKHADIYLRWQATELLKVMDKEGELPREYPCPVQVWRFGGDLTLVTIGGEVVVDYVLRLKRELGAEKLWVAGYCNDVFAYVPSKRVLEEGGYEATGAMVYYVQPGAFAPSVEETLLSKVHQLLAETGDGKGK